MNKELLIIGKTDSSKTAFITQLYGRLQKGKSNFFLRETVEDLSPIIKSRIKLAGGNDPEPTPPENRVHIRLPIKSKDIIVDLTVPDYGGEQIKQILLTRNVDNNWIEAIQKSNNIILFIRLHNINFSKDLSQTIPNEATTASINQTPNAYKISEQSSLIEFLQILLSFKEYDYHKKNDKIKITITLTCWDELETELTPIEVFEKELPLLNDFVKSNWNSSFIKIAGLSALGFSLEDPKNKEKYQIEGSENFGFLIKENGEKTSDITELISLAIQ